MDSVLKLVEKNLDSPLKAQVGISAATMYRYEKNEIANMGTDNLQPIATALQTTPAYLMGWTDEPEPQSSWDLSEETRKKLKSFFATSSIDDNLSSKALSFASDFDKLDDWGKDFMLSTMVLVLQEHRRKSK